VVGVNGSGKTTTIGKLAAKLAARGPQGDAGSRRYLSRRGDRAAEKFWGERTGSPVIAGARRGSDSASLAFNALTSAREGKLDVLLIDTAGRLQNKAELMNELEKVVRVIRKVDASAPHAVLLGARCHGGDKIALSQVEAFARTAGVTGLVMTKLDGTARAGGILVALAEKAPAAGAFHRAVGEGDRRSRRPSPRGISRRRLQGLKADAEVFRAAYSNRHPRGAALLRGVSKDGREHGACGHPSRLAEDGEHLRMTGGVGGRSLNLAGA